MPKSSLDHLHIYLGDNMREAHLHASIDRGENYIQFLNNGMSIKDLGKLIGLDPNTIRKHVRRVDDEYFGSREYRKIKYHNHPGYSREYLEEKGGEIHGVGTYGYDRAHCAKSTDIVELYCFACEEYFEQLASSHITSGGRGCFKCSIRRKAENHRKTLGQVLQKCQESHGDKFDYSRVTDPSCNSIAEIGCPEHGWFTQKIGVHSRGTGCPQCNESKGERYVRLVLEKYGVEYEPEKTFDECRDKGLLRFDFYLPEYNLICEFHGFHHYKESDLFGNLKDVQRRDKIKVDFVKKKKINMITIKYTKIKKIEEILINKLNLLQRMTI